MNGWDRRRGQSRMLETVAAASLALAVAFAAWSLCGDLAIERRAGLAIVTAVTAFVLARLFLERFANPKPRAVAIRSAEPSALLVRLQDVLAEASASEASNELLLDDPLPAAQADSRVVQLFQSSALPTAGELQARIDRHLDGRASPPEPPADHSSELFEALETLKRSLG